MKFIDRVKELAFLEEKWKEQKAQLVILWGKRRVGKTELTKQFIKDKPHVYFLSENTNDKEQLFRFSQALGHFYNEPLLIYEELKQKSQKVQWCGKTRKEYFCLFSKKGFTDARVKLALEDGVALFQEDKLVVPIRVKNE